MKWFTLSFSLLLSLFVRAQVPSGTLLWKYSTRDKIISSPYVDSSCIYYGSDDGNFYCNALSDGRLLWKFSTGKSIRSSATIAEGKVFFGCEDGLVYALDARQGKLQWKFATKGERSYDLWDYYRSSPVYHKGLVYIGSGDGNVYAINASTGKPSWSFATNGIVHADPVVSNDTLFVGSFDGQFYALQASSGKLIWKFKTIGDRNFPKGEVQKAALVTKDAVYFGSRDYNIYALNKRTGEGLWNMKEDGSWIIATPLEKDGNLFFGTSDSHVFYSLSNFSGQLQWKTALPLRSYNTAIAYDSLIIAGCYDGFLYGFGEKSGNLQWKFQTAGSQSNHTTVFDSTGHFRKDFTIYGDDALTRSSEAKILALGSILSTPVIKNGIIYFGSTDGNLYAVKIASR